MKVIDHDWHGKPIYDPLDVMVQSAILPVFYKPNAVRCFWCARELVDGRQCCRPEDRLD